MRRLTFRLTLLICLLTIIFSTGACSKEPSTITTTATTKITTTFTTTQNITKTTTTTVTNTIFKWILPIPEVQYTERLITTFPGKLTQAQYQISPDSKKIAFLYDSETADDSYVVVNEEEGKHYQFIENLTFSPDGQNLAYTADTGEQWLAVINETETVLSNGFIENIFFSPDSRHIVYSACDGERWFVILDGKTDEKSYEKIHPFGFSTNSELFAYAASSGGEQFIVVNGVESQPFDYITDFSFSPDGHSYAYRAKSSENLYTVIDGSLTQGHADFGWSGVTFHSETPEDFYFYRSPYETIYSQNGEHSIQVVRAFEKSYIVADGVEGKHYQNIGQVIFSPDGQHYAYSAERDFSTDLVVVDGVEGKHYDNIGKIIFSPDGQHYAYFIYTDHKYYLVLDGIESQPYADADLRNGIILFSPDSRYIIYVANDLLNINNEPQDYYCISNVIFDTADSFHFLARKVELGKDGHWITNIILVYGKFNGTPETPDVPATPLIIEPGTINPPQNAQTIDGLQLSPEYVKETMDAFFSVRTTVITDDIMNDIENGIHPPFDIMSYFSALKHLSMKPGYVLDYVVLYDGGFGGRPIVYVRKTDQPPYTNYEEMTADSGNQSENMDVFSFVSLVMGGDVGAFRDYIQLDGTPESYFEYVVLNMMGGQFYLFWHANYNDATLVYDEEFLQTLLSGSFLGDPYPEDLWRKARYLDFTPIISYQDGNVLVTVIYFTKWGGFIKSITTISGNPPHNITNIENRTVYEYQCGITF